MSPENKNFLDTHLFQFTTLERAFYVRGLSQQVRDGMLKAMREEFSPTFDYCGTCTTDVANMIKSLYTNYYNYLKGYHKDTNTYKDITEGIEEMNKLPIIVKAKFDDNI